MRITRTPALEAEDRRRRAICKANAQVAIEHDDAERQRSNQRIEAIVFGVFGFVFRYG
jgi:hypothetical protein